MSKEKITALIDKAIGKKGPLRIPAYWMREVFVMLIGWFSNSIDNVAKKIPTKVGELENNADYATNDAVSAVGERIFDKYVFLDSVNNNVVLTPNAHTIIRQTIVNKTTIRFPKTAKYSISLATTAIIDIDQNAVVWKEGSLPPLDGKRIVCYFDVRGKIIYGSWAYYGETWLEATYSASGKIVGNTASIGETVIDGQAKGVIKNYAFENSTSEKKVYYLWCPDAYAGYNGDYSDTFRGSYVFSFVENLTNIVFPNGIRVIPLGSFRYTSIVDAIIPEGVRYIGASAFDSCENLTKVSIPDSLTVISNSFTSCDNIKEVHIPRIESLLKFTTPTSPTISPFYSPYRLKFADLYVDGNIVKHLIVPESIKRLSPVLAGGTFEEVTIPETVEELDDSCFRHCNNIKRFNGKFASEDGSFLIKNVNGLDKIVAAAIGGKTEITINNRPVKEAFAMLENRQLIVYYNAEGYNQESAFKECKFKKLITSVYGGTSTNIYNNVFYYSSFYEVEYGATHINARLFGNADVNRFYFKKNITYISDGALAMPMIVKTLKREYIDFTANTQVPTLSKADSVGVEDGTKIFVPESLYDSWCGATNWSLLAEYLVAVPNTYIHFSVDDATRLAVSNQTWEQWIESKFFSGTYSIVDGLVMSDTANNIQLNGVNVHATDEIVADAEYTILINNATE